MTNNGTNDPDGLFERENLFLLLLKHDIGWLLRLYLMSRANHSHLSHFEPLVGFWNGLVAGITYLRSWFCREGLSSSENGPHSFLVR